MEKESFGVDDARATSRRSRFKNDFLSETIRILEATSVPR